MKFKPIIGGYDESWLINRLDKNNNDSKFALIGSIWWMNGMALLVKNSSIDINKFYEKVTQLKFEDDALNNIFCSILMSVDYLNTVIRIDSLDETDSLIRIAIIAWYYGIYNASQAMILATDKSSPQTHAHTADEWYEKFASRNLIPPPFNYHLDSLVENEYKIKISQYEDFDRNEHKKPRDISTARGVC